jgi:hypothetical protein
MAGTTANGLVNSPTPEAKGKAAEIAVAAAQYKINVTRANLSASRDAYTQVSQERQRQQSEITRTIVEMTRVDLENVTLKGMRYFFERWRSPPTDRPRFLSRDDPNPAQGDRIVQYPPRALLAAGPVLPLDCFTCEECHGQPYGEPDGRTSQWKEARPRWCLVARFSYQTCHCIKR